MPHASPLSPFGLPAVPLAFPIPEELAQSKTLYKDSNFRSIDFHQWQKGEAAGVTAPTTSQPIVHLTYQANFMDGLSSRGKSALFSNICSSNLRQRLPGSLIDRSTEALVDALLLCQKGDRRMQMLI